MKRGKKEKLKQKKLLFIAKNGYYPIHKKANKLPSYHYRHYPGNICYSRIRHYSKSESVKMIKDEDILFDIAKNSEYGVEAVENHNLRDTDKLLELINGDNGYDVRIAAVRRIKDEDVLLNLISNHYDWHVRREALERINPRNESVFIDVALCDDDYMVRRCAVKYITHQDTLVYLSRNDEDVFVRIASLKKIKNTDIIIYAAKHDPNWRVRKFAISIIDDEDILKGLLKIERNRYLKETIEKRIRKFNLIE